MGFMGNLWDGLKKISQQQAQQQVQQQENMYPLYGQMRNQALGMGKAMAGDTLAQISAMTGGRPSSNAINQSSQVYQNYANKAMDYLPQVEQMMYDRKQNDINRQDKVNESLGYVNPYAGKTINPETDQYAKDYQAEINKRLSTPDTADNSLINDLRAAQANKLFSDPQLLQKYGQQLGYMTQNAKQQQYENSRVSNQDKLNNDVTLAQLTGIYNNKPTMANQQLQLNKANQANDNAAQWASINNSADRLAWDKSSSNPDNMYKLAQANTKAATKDYKTNPNFASELKVLNKNKGDFYSTLMANPDAYITEYGYPGFKELYNMSKPNNSLDAFINAFGG